MRFFCARVKDAVTQRAQRTAEFAEKKREVVFLSLLKTLRELCGSLRPLRHSVFYARAKKSHIRSFHLSSLRSFSRAFCSSLQSDTFSRSCACFHSKSPGARNGAFPAFCFVADFAAALAAHLLPAQHLARFACRGRHRHFGVFDRGDCDAPELG